MTFQNKLFLISFFYVSCLQINADQQQPSPIVVHVSPAIYNNHNNSVSTQHQSTQQVEHLFKLELPTLPTLNLPSKESILGKLESSYNSLYNNLYDYKWYISGGFIASIYSYLLVKIYTIHRLLENPKSWCLWKEEIPLNRLSTLDSLELLTQLHIDICKKYFDATKIPKDICLLKYFLEDINYEKSMLVFYKSIYSYSNFFYISKLFKFNKTVEQIDQYIARLNFLIDLYFQNFIQTNNFTKKNSLENVSSK